MIRETEVMDRDQSTLLPAIKSPSLRWLHEFPAIVALKKHFEHITQDTADLMLKDLGIAIQKSVGRDLGSLSPL